MAAVGVLLGVLLAGCGSTALRQVDQSDRDRAGVYDGVWSGLIVSTAAKQPGPGNWLMDCGDMAGTQMSNIVVDDGVASLGGQEDSPVANVSAFGKFRFVIPMSEVATAAGRSDSSINNGDMTLIMYGSLRTQKGSLTIGIADFGNNGCTSEVEFSKP